MKKIFMIVALIATALFAVSCNKTNNGKEESNLVNIIGTWKLDGTSQGISVEIPFGVKTAIVTENTITLKKDMFERENPETIVYNYTRKGNTLTFTPAFLDTFTTLDVFEGYKCFFLGSNIEDEEKGFFYVFSE